MIIVPGCLLHKYIYICFFYIFLSILGIQEYIYENGRVDNIFTDVYYDRFTECLDDVIKRYEVRLNAQGNNARLIMFIIHTSF